MSCWPELSREERETCFDPNSEPKHRLTFKSFWKAKAWVVKGRLQHEWNSLLPQIIQISDGQKFREQLFGKAHRHSGGTLPLLPKWSLYLVGRKARAEALSPMIIAEHGDINVAKRASRAFEDLKDGSLGKLLQGYDFHYAEYAIKLCADNGNSVLSGSEQFSINLCGLHVVISSPGECISAAGFVWTHATIGGCVEINGKHYGLTAAHAFPDIVKGNPDFPNEEDTSEAGIGFLHSRNVYAHRGPLRNFPDDDLIIPAQTPDMTMLLNGPSTDLEGIGSSPILCDRNHDWALIPIVNGNVTLHNQVDLGNGQLLSISGVADTFSDEIVYVASGVTQPSAAEFSGTSSAMLLPGSDCLQVVRSANRQSECGDCGSWIIDAKCRPSAMIVAATGERSEGAAETSCLPLAPIFSTIQDYLKSQIAVPSLSEIEPGALSSYDFTSRLSKSSMYGRQESSEESSDTSSHSRASDSDDERDQATSELGVNSRRQRRPPTQPRRSSQDTTSTVSIIVEGRQGEVRTSDGRDEPKEPLRRQLALTDETKITIFQLPSEDSNRKTSLNDSASKVQIDSHEASQLTRNTAVAPIQNTVQDISEARDALDPRGSNYGIQDPGRKDYRANSDAQLVVRANRQNKPRSNWSGSGLHSEGTTEDFGTQALDRSRRATSDRDSTEITGKEIVIRRKMSDEVAPVNQTNLPSKDHGIRHGPKSSSRKQGNEGQSLNDSRANRLNAKPKHDAMRNEAYLQHSSSPEKTSQNNLYGSDEEIQRKFARRARLPVSRAFSRRYIDPQTLNAYGIGWEWERYDDWNVVVDKDLAELLEMELRAHTKGIHLQREQQSNSKGISSDDTLPWKPMAPKRNSFERLRDDRRAKKGLGLGEELESKESHAGILSTEKGRNPGALLGTNDKDFARYNDEQELGFECHLFDLQFESDVQDLLWEAGCSMDFCDNIMKDHAEKERRKAVFAQKITDREKTWRQRPKQTSTSAASDLRPPSRPWPGRHEDVNVDTGALALRNNPATSAVKAAAQDRRASQERYSSRGKQLDFA